jgi:aurora kinase, other
MWCLDDFIIYEMLGTGRYGKVFKVQDKKTTKIYALKIMKLNDLPNNEKSEITNHIKLNHTNILKLYGHFKDKTSLYLVLEYINNTQLVMSGPIKESTLSLYIFQLAKALEYCHKQKIIHRDVKIDNILLDTDNNLKLADFGFSTVLGNSTLNEYCGTLDYISPEMLNCDFYNENVDIWSLGICTYELLVGNTPFKEESYDDTFNRILNIDLTLPKTLSKDVTDFLLRILCTRDKRMNLIDILNHPWITSGQKCKT